MVRMIKRLITRGVFKMAKIIAVFMAIITALSLMVDKMFRIPPADTDPTTTAYTEESTTAGSSDITETTHSNSETSTTFSLSQVAEYSGHAYAAVNSNNPYFKTTEITTSVFETYSELDNLGRCGVAYANICKEIMPTDKREDIGSVKPSGWTYNGKSNNNKYEFVDGQYIYNRCHLIGFQLAGENANPKNLITGTRYFNVDGMLPFENLVDDYVEETHNHVLYRVTPIYKGTELVARGVLMEGLSVEDNGRGVKFCVFVYNVQPGVTINYATGQNSLTTEKTTTAAVSNGYIINTKTLKIHRLNCEHVQTLSSNLNYVNDNINNLISQGYSKCKVCNPE